MLEMLIFAGLQIFNQNCHNNILFPSTCVPKTLLCKLCPLVIPSIKIMFHENVIQLMPQSPKCILHNNCYNLKCNRNPFYIHSTSSLKIWKNVSSQGFIILFKISGTHSVTELTIVSFRCFTYPLLLQHCCKC